MKAVTYRDNAVEYCPHCGREARFSRGLKRIPYIEFEDNEDHLISMDAAVCSLCNRLVLTAQAATKKITGFSRRYNPQIEYENETELLIWPIRQDIPDELPNVVASDYKEAVKLLSVGSPDASAVTSRRCLQTFIQNVLFKEPAIEEAIKGKILHSLDSEITAIIKSSLIPSDIEKQIQCIREMGNIAAHFTAQDGFVVKVEGDEAKWLIKFLEILFRWYYIRLPEQQEIMEQISAKQALAKKVRDEKKDRAKKAKAEKQSE